MESKTVGDWTDYISPDENGIGPYLETVTLSNYPNWISDAKLRPTIQCYFYCYENAPE